MAAQPVFWGMLTGAIIAGVLTWTGHKTVFGVHGGVIGLAANFLIAVVGSYLVTVTATEEEKEDLKKIDLA